MQEAHAHVILWSSEPQLGPLVCALLPVVMQKMMPQLTVQATVVKSVEMWCEETQRTFSAAMANIELVAGGFVLSVLDIPLLVTISTSNVGVLDHLKEQAWCTSSSRRLCKTLSFASAEYPKKVPPRKKQNKRPTARQIGHLRATLGTSEQMESGAKENRPAPSTEVQQIRMDTTNPVDGHCAPQQKEKKAITVEPVQHEPSSDAFWKEWDDRRRKQGCANDALSDALREKKDRGKASADYKRTAHRSGLPTFTVRTL